MTAFTVAQREAIESDERSLLVLAGPGSGKSTVLAQRIARIESGGGDLARMAIMTFTNAAAREIEEKIRKVARGGGTISTTIPPAAEEDRIGFVGTLHAFALRMLKEFGAGFGYGDRTSVISPESAVDLLESKAKTLGCKTSTKELLELKRNGRPTRGRRLSLAETVLASYFDEMKESAVVDYDILLDELLVMLSPSPESLFGDAAHRVVIKALAERFTHLFVDEVQDSAPIDWRIYRALPIEFKFLVGDPDQAIYAFRGGRVAETLEESRRPTTRVIRLEENFRSRPEICAAAQHLIERNSIRAAKRTVSVARPGGSVAILEESEAPAVEIARVASTIKRINRPELADVALRGADDAIGPHTVAILARTNAIADDFRKLLPSMGVEVVATKKSELPDDWLLARALAELLVEPENDALGFLYLVSLYEVRGASPKEARAAAQAARRAATAAGKSINRANIGLQRVTLASSMIEAIQAAKGISRDARAIALDRYRELPPGATPLDFALSLGEVHEYSKEEDGPGVRIMTMHGAKGREFDVVFVVGFEDESIPGRAAKVSPEAVEEERRLAYVAATRARRDLYLSWCSSRKSPWGEVQPRTPSRFVAELAPFWVPPIV